MLSTVLLLSLLAGCPLSPTKNDALVRSLDGEIVALKVKLAYAEANGTACGGKTEPDPIYAELVQVFSGSDVTVDRQGPTIQVTIPMAELFSASSVRVRNEAAQTMDLLSTALNLHPEKMITVEGHVDDQPVPSSLRRTLPTPWELSAIRATAVARELVETYKVAPSRVTVASRGAIAPVADNDTPEGRASNRRIILYIRAHGTTIAPKNETTTPTP